MTEYINYVKACEAAARLTKADGVPRTVQVNAASGRLGRKVTTYVVRKVTSSEWVVNVQAFKTD